MRKLFDSIDLSHAPGLVLLYLDRQLQVRFVNPFGLKLLSYEQAEQLVGQPFEALLPEARKEEILAAFNNDNPPTHIDFELLRADDTPIPMSWFIDDRGDTAGLVSPILLIGIDTTTIRHSQEVARLFQNVSSNYPGSILITDPNQVILYANPAAINITGYASEELIGQTPALFRSGETPKDTYRSLWESINRGEIWKGEFINRRKNGERYLEGKTIAAIRDTQDNIQSLFMIGEDLSQREHFERQIDQLMLFDQLTGLPNRSSFLSTLTTTLDAAQKNGQQISVLHVDFDDFKNINSLLGQDGADIILAEAGARLTQALRQSDVVARIGSDEFAILLSPLSAGIETDSGDVATRILESFYQPFFYAEHAVSTTASIGVAYTPCGGDSALQILGNAMSATLQAKSYGGNRYCRFEEAMAVLVNERRELLQAIENGEMQLLFQPQVRLFSGSVTGLEALIRWHHPERGVVSPDKFIPMAEKGNQIVAIGEWVLNEACRQMRAWLDAGLPPIKVAINLAARHFRLPTLPAHIANVLDAYQIESRFLEIEITESAMMQDMAAATRNMTQLKELGVSISLDDFGTGYSSMTYLSRFPIDVVKIDQSFIRDITTNPVNAAIAQATIAMSHKLGKTVLAEGVETIEQMQYLRRSECDEMQGYYFSKPCPPDDIARLLLQDVRMDVSGQASIAGQNTILIVDDEINIASALKRILRREGYNILSAESPAEGFSLLAQHPVQLVISDQRMPDMTGTEFLSLVKSLYPETVRMVLSAYSEIATVTDAINKGAAYRFLTKPWNDEQMKEEIRGALRHWRDLYAKDATPN